MALRSKATVSSLHLQDQRPPPSNGYPEAFVTAVGSAGHRAAGDFHDQGRAIWTKVGAPVRSGQCSSSRMSTRGNPPDTASVSDAFVKPARSKSARVPTYAIV